MLYSTVLFKGIEPASGAEQCNSFAGLVLELIFVWAVKQKTGEKENEFK